MLDPLFRDDLMTLITSGVPLWDGIADIVLRPALSSEEVHWQASRTKAICQGNIDGEDDTWIAFLVPLSNMRTIRRGGT